MVQLVRSFIRRTKMSEFLFETVTLGTLVVAGVSYASGLWLGWAIWGKRAGKKEWENA